MDPDRQKKIVQGFGDKLRDFRNQRGWSTRDLEAETGIGHSHITRLENGWKSPNLIMIYKLAEALQVEPADLLP